MDKMQKHNADVENVRQRPAVAPRVDVYENEHEYLIVADLPGVTKQDLRLDIDDDELKLEGTRNTSQEGALVAGECRPVDYRRKFVVPQGVDREKIDAELTAGVLRLKLPKADALRPRQISVRAG
jgi:HSP20 family molecular chaperone IbpA